MRTLGMMVAMIFMSAGVTIAANINLIDGRVVQGDIVKQDSRSLQVSVDGVTMTYYADEIKDIDGKPFASVAPAAGVKPQAVAPAAVTVVGPAGVVKTRTVAPAAVALGAGPVPAAQTETGAPAAIAAIVPAVIVPEKKALILKFMDVFGTRQALNKNFEAMLAQIAKDKPQEAQTISQRVKIDEIIERLLPIYDRNFTSEDLKAFISFYESEEGQKLIKTIPQLMKESVAESINYMQEKFPEVRNGAQ